MYEHMLFELVYFDQPYIKFIIMRYTSSSFSSQYSSPYTSYFSTTLPKKYPEDIECIISSSDAQKGSLYLSNLEAAENPQTLRKLGIGAILSCAKGHRLDHAKSLIPYYMYVPADDHQKCDLTMHFDQCVDFITSTLSKTNLIVHCLAGVSRSVSMVIAYLIRERNMSYDQAFNFVKSRRKIINPNDGFITQLRRYDHKTKNTNKRGQREEIPKSNSVSYRDRATVTPPKEVLQIRAKYGYLNYASSSIELPSANRPFSAMKSPNISTPINRKTYDPETLPRSNTIAQTYTAQKSNFISPKLTAPSSNAKSMNYIPEQHQIGNQVQGRSMRTINLKENHIQIKLNQQSSKKGFFDEMNRQLNEKIERIKLKYEQERNKIYEKYGRDKLTTKAYNSIDKYQKRPNSPIAKQTTQKKPYPPYEPTFLRTTTDRSPQYSGQYGSMARQVLSRQFGGRRYNDLVEYRRRY